MPEAQPLALLRRNIDRKPEVIRRVLTGAALRKKVLGGIPNDEKKAVEAFALHNAENALKTKPKVRLNLCQSKHSSSRVYFLYCVSCSMQADSWSVGIFVACSLVQCGKDCNKFRASRRVPSRPSRVHFARRFSTPGQRCSTRLWRLIVDNLQIMVCPFLHIQQGLVSVAPATAPILTGKHVC